jgi:flavin reductase (DIM6/NTAB) family NADH-FMN oxidoreductase RutF
MKRPWNIPNLPVYSLATYHEQKVNMNICTYVAAVSMNPKRYMVAVYHQTRTLFNIQHSNTAVLQLLSKEHISVVNTLGKKSGQDYDKQSYLTKKRLLEKWEKLSVLTNSAAWIKLKKIWAKEAGDHALFLFDVVAFKTHHENILTLDDLREKKLIRI